MSMSMRTRLHTHLHAPRSRGRRIALLAASLVTLAAAIFGTVGLVAAANGGGPAAGFTPNPGKVSQAPASPVVGQKAHVTCNDPGQPPCPPPPTQTVLVKAPTPAAVLAALPTIPGYMSPLQAFPAPPNSTYSFDTPVLVLPAVTFPSSMQAGHTSDEIPHFVIRASVNGVRSITYDLTYDPATGALGNISVGQQQPNDPAYSKPFPWAGVSSSTAIATLRGTHGLAIASGTQPQLVFFAFNRGNPNQFSTWRGGGDNPEDAIWRLKGSDGQLYFVGVDGHLYLPKDLPVISGATFTQP